MNKELQEELKKLMRIFPNAFINHHLELILIPMTNTYFLLEGCESRRAICAKLLMWASRTISKGMPYDKLRLNHCYRENYRMCLNKYLETDFSSDDIKLIYQRLGNGVNPELTYQFIDSGFDMGVLTNG